MSNKDLLEEAGKLFIQNSGGKYFVTVNQSSIVIRQTTSHCPLGSEKISKEVTLNCYTTLLQNRMASDVLSSTVDPIFEIYGEEGFITLQPYLEIFNNLLEISQTLYN